MGYSLHQAVMSGNSSAVMNLLHSGMYVNILNDDGRTPLSLAAERGTEAVVKLLLAHRAINTGAEDNNGCTPLSLAAQWGRVAVVKLLLSQNSVKPDAKDKYGRTPLSWAAYHRREAVVKLLLAEEGVNPEAKDKNGHTPLSWATYNQDSTESKTIARLLLNQADARDQCGRTQLSRAAEEGDETKARILLMDNVINPDVKDNDGRTPLSWAAENGQDAVVKLLLAQKDVDPNAKDNKGRTSLLLAAENGQQAVTELLAPRDTVTLHMLVKEGSQTLVERLLEAKYDINVKDSFNRTPLHVAISSRHLGIATMLITLEAHINSEDSDGMTPLRLAIRHKDCNLIKSLLKHSSQTKNITASQWLQAYERQAPDIALLSEGRQEKSLRFLTEEGLAAEFARSSTGVGSERRLFLVSDYSPWERCLVPILKDTLQSDRSRIDHQEQTHGAGIYISIAVWVPARQDSGNQRFFGIAWNKFAVAWNMMKTKTPDGVSHWISVDHFSMLPYGWLPNDSVEFFSQFILNLKEKWLKICELAGEHLSDRRLDQLRWEGKNSRLIQDLAKDAQAWAELRSILRGQVQGAGKFAVEHCRHYKQDTGLKHLQEDIYRLQVNVTHQIDQLEQTVRDLLQLEFAWVSINETHLSTTLAKSMQRLTWITFIFLPAMFTSSLFGMNVDLLKDNPDWRWYILFVGISLAVTGAGWVAFKNYSSIGLRIKNMLDYTCLGVSRVSRKLEWRRQKELPR